MRWPPWQPRSLRRLAVSEKAKLERASGGTRAGHARQSLRLCAWNLTHHSGWALLLIVPSLGVAFLPIGDGLSPLDTEKEATPILQTLWQVEAAALALSLAVVIFILEAVYSTRPRPSLRGLTEWIRVPAIFYAGVYGLVLTGMVLMGAGSGAPGGWAATWAVVWAALSAAGLILLFVTTLNQVEPDALYQRWLATIEGQVQRVVEAEIFERVAAAALRTICQEVALEFRPVFGSESAPSLEKVPAKRTGTIRDVNLWRLRKAGGLARNEEAVSAENPESPAVLVHIGAAVRQRDPVMLVPGSVANGMNLSGAFKIETRRTEANLDAILTQVHEEALRAIREASPGSYAGITDVYERLLLALPLTWAKYGQQFGPGIAGGMNPFELTLLDRVERNLYDELEQAALGASREIAQEAVNVPIAVASRSTEPRAIALAGRMLRLFVAVQSALIRSPSSDNRGSLLAYSWLRLSEYGRYYAERLVTDDDGSAEDREYGAQALRQVFDAYALIGKAIIDSTPRDTKALGEINRYLSEFLQHWTPEHDHPQQWDVELLEQQPGVDQDALEQVRIDVAENERRAQIKSELDRWRAVQRFGLLFWALHRLGGTRDEAYVEAWNALAGYFGDLSETAGVVNEAIRADFEDHGPWSNWVLSELPIGQAHFPAVDAKLIQAFIVLALNRVDPDGPVPQFEPLEWLSSRSTEIRGLLEGLIANDAVRPVLPEERLEDRAEKVIEAFEAMQRAREEQKDQRIIDSPVDLEAVDGFKRQVRETWASQHLVGPALDAAGTYEVIEGEAEEGTKWAIQQWAPKGMFVADPGVLGADWLATDIGRNLAVSEPRHLVDAALLSAEFAGAEGQSLAERLRAAIAEVRGRGDQLVVLVPMNWQLTQALEVDPARRRGGDSEPPAWVPDEEGRGAFVGTVDGVPVFDVINIPDDRIVVIALDSFLRWRQWRVAEGDEVAVDLTAYDEEEARALVEEHEDLFRTEERTTTEARARHLRTLCLLDVYERFRVDVVDAEAARWLTVPDELRAP
jgi:hypothetical protein